MSNAIQHADGLYRCTWPDEGNQIYVDYHDSEWGVPEWDDRALYEKLVLDGFQAGLSWITILRKRENFRKAFDNFNPEKIARYDARKKASLMKDAGIVRNRLKVEGAVLSARAWLEVMDKGPGFSILLWDFLDGKPKVNQFKTTKQIPAETPLSQSDVQGACISRLQVCRADHRLCLHAGGRHGQRPSGEVPPPRRMPRARRQEKEMSARPQRQPATPAPRLAAHAVGPPARPARPLPARRRDRGHRARARPRRALERPDLRRAHLLGRAAHAAGRGDRASALAAARPQAAAGDPAARRARVRDRRHDLAVQGGDRRFLQGCRSPAAGRDPPAFRAPREARRRAQPPAQGRRPGRGLSGGHAPCRIRAKTRRDASSARRPSCRRRSSATTSPPGPRKSPKHGCASGWKASPASDASGAPAGALYLISILEGHS